MVMPSNIPSDVWKKINIKSSSECWEYTGCKDRNGYGLFGYNKHQYFSHRIIYELTKGNIPEKIQVCHSCDNPKCCNPKHLFLGTNQDNADDKVSKRRQSRLSGERHGSHKLTSNQIFKIRMMYKTGKYYYRELGKIFKCSGRHIGDIINNKKWRYE
jgi:hypothetical protein